MRPDGQQLGPPLAQDLHAAEGPAEALLLEPVEIQRHHARAVRGAVVHPAIPAAEDAQAGLGVFGDARLAPAPDLLQRGAADQAHGAAEDDRVAVRPRPHGHVKEIAEAEEQSPQIAVVLPVAVVLRALREPHRGIVEVPHHRREELRGHDVVGINDPDDLDVRRQPPGGLVERPGLVARPVLQVDELETLTQLSAQRLQGAPQGGIGRVVVHHLHRVVRVVDNRQRLERAPHDVNGFVVGGYLQDHPGHRLTGGPHQLGVAAAEHVDDLERI